MQPEQNNGFVHQALEGKKYLFSDYLADMAIYRMTKEEVQKRKLMVKEEEGKLVKYKRIAKSSSLIKKELIVELEKVDEDLNNWLKKKNLEAAKLSKSLSLKGKKTKRKARV